MAFTLYGTTFVDGVTVVPAAFLNKLRTEMPSAVDGRGGLYTNTGLLQFNTSGAGFRITGDSNVVIDSSGTLTIGSAIAGSLSYVSSSISLYVDIDEGSHAPSATRWVYESANPTTLSNGPRWVQQATGQDYPMLVPLHLPAGQTITGCLVRVHGAIASSVPGGAPSTAGSSPRLDLMYRDVSSTTLTSLGSALDTAANQAAYNAVHSISITGLSETVSSTRRYYLKFMGEAGIFSGAGLQLLAGQVTLGITSQSKWFT